MARYNPKDIEPKWQHIWDETELYKTDLDSDKKKYIAMSMFNYPSGAGIHIGHAMNYTISDVMARYKRQQGYESYHPIGWDSFGLPAENYAIKAGVSPQESMATIIPSYHKQYKAMGWSNDWSKEIATHKPRYYQWTQWVFSEMYRQGLAYQDARMQWWCTQCQTVLANEQVIDGKCWRHDKADDLEVEKKEVKQWFFKITDYADELLEAIDELDWTDSVKQAQRNWIGRSVGAEIDFDVLNHDQKLTVFTTRADTLFGATYMVLAPEHDSVDQITTQDQKSAVDQYVKSATAKSELERKQEKDKTGAFTGAYALNPATGEEIPIWIADYVLGGYGTGAIMAVPAHDQRDYEFAKKFDLPIREVITATTGERQENPEFRRSIVAIVRNDKGEFLTVDWGDQGDHLFIGGGIDDGEDVIETAKREIAEEAGYTDVEFVSKTEKIIHSYFAHSKNVPRQIEAYGLLFDLKSEKREEQQLEKDEQDSFTVQWLSRGDTEAKVTEGLHRGVYDRLVLDQVYTDEGILKNSGEYDGITSFEARDKIVTDLEAKGTAREKVQYKMRDWSVSRQRYWGAPIPIINCEDCGNVLVADEDLPVVLPELADFAPSGDGRSALARAEDWLKVDCPECGKPAERETDTLDTYVCSSWYMYRYFDPHNDSEPFSKQRVVKWAPIDFYNGGDHVTAHLLYARFIARFFTKIGIADEPEPFKKFLFNGKVTAADGTMFSKSLGNGVDPMEVIESGYGADALRLYLMFAAPLEQWAKWNPKGVPGTYRYLNRVWDFVNEFLEAKPVEDDGDTSELETAVMASVHRAIKKVTQDLEDLSFNTAIAAQMKLSNELRELVQDLPFGHAPQTWMFAVESSLQLLAPFAPHITEELWNALHDNDTSVHVNGWPAWDEELVQEELVTVVVQINGKVRAQLELPAEVSNEDMVKAAKQNEKIASYLKDDEVKKTITVPGKVVNFVI